MRATGIVRNIDEIGRIVIPVELRRSLNLKEKCPMEIFVGNDQIILKKYSAHEACHITGKLSEKNITLANGKLTISQETAQSLLSEIDAHLNPKE